MSQNVSDFKFIVQEICTGEGIFGLTTLADFFPSFVFNLFMRKK